METRDAGIRLPPAPAGAGSRGLRKRGRAAWQLQAGSRPLPQEAPGLEGVIFRAVNLSYHQSQGASCSYNIHAPAEPTAPKPFPRSRDYDCCFQEPPHAVF